MQKILLILLITLAAAALGEFLRRRAVNKNLRALYDAAYVKRDAELFNLLINSPQCKMVLSQATRELMKLNFCIAQDDLARAKKVSAHLASLRLGGEDAKAFYGAALGYMAEKGEAEEAKRLLEALEARFKNTQDPAAAMLALDCRLTYDVYIAKDVSRIDDLRGLIEAAPDDNARSVYRFRLAKLLYAAGDRSGCAAQLKAAQQETASAQAKRKIARILNGGWNEL